MAEVSNVATTLNNKNAVAQQQKQDLHGGDTKKHAMRYLECKMYGEKIANDFVKGDFDKDGFTNYCVAYELVRDSSREAELTKKKTEKSTTNATNTQTRSEEEELESALKDAIKEPTDANLISFIKKRNEIVEQSITLTEDFKGKIEG